MASLFKFEIDGKEAYGQRLAIDSRGRWVMEIKGTGQVVPVDRNDVEEVRPYTFEAKSGQHTCHYEAQDGDVAVGDVLLSDSGHIYRVTRLDTKADTPKSAFIGVVLAVKRRVGGTE